MDSHMSALMGVPQSLSEHDVTAQLPEFATSSTKSLALGIHIKLARATSSILQSKLYCKQYNDSMNTDTFEQPSMVGKAENRASFCIASKTH